MRVWAETWNGIAVTLLMFGDPSLTLCGNRAARAILDRSFEGFPILAFQGLMNIKLRSREDVCHRQGKNMTFDRFSRPFLFAMTSSPSRGRTFITSRPACSLT